LTVTGSRVVVLATAELLNEDFLALLETDDFGFDNRTVEGGLTKL
jgi:hypothetical protein